MFNNAAALTLTDSTVSGNSSVSDGGGVYNFFGTATLLRTLVSGNTAPEGTELYRYGTLTAANYNLFGHDGLNNAQAFFGFTPSGSDITAIYVTAPNRRRLPTSLTARPSMQ